MDDKRVIKEIAESNKHCAKNLEELIANLKRAKMSQEIIQKAIDMRNKYQEIADYNDELVKEMEEMEL